MKRLLVCLILAGVVGCGSSEPLPSQDESPDPPRVNTNDEKAKSEYERGVGCSQRQDWATAVVHYSEAIKFNPRNYLFYINRADAYSELGEYLKAIDDFTEAIPHVRGQLELPAKLYNSRGLAYQKIGQNAKAKADFDRAKELGYEPEED